MIKLLRPAGILACLLAGGNAAHAATSDWNGGDNARVRLVVAGVDESGKLAAGIEIELQPGWKTYWRTPGDAGIPPRVDFSGSINLGPEADISYPLPRRLDDGFAATNIYEGTILLPVRLDVADPTKPARLVLGLDIGVCEEICIPAHYDLALEIDLAAKDAEARQRLAAAAAKLPGPPEPGVIAAERIERAGGTDRKPVFSIDVVAPDAGKTEIFVEGPADCYPAPPKLASTEGRRATYTVEFSRTGSKVPIGGNQFRVTVATPERSIESLLTLD